MLPVCRLVALMVKPPIVPVVDVIFPLTSRPLDVIFTTSDALL